MLDFQILDSKIQFPGFWVVYTEYRTIACVKLVSILRGSSRGVAPFKTVSLGLETFLGIFLFHCANIFWCHTTSFLGNFGKKT